jgi:hypothetical protein
MTSWADVSFFRGPVLRGVGRMVDFVQEVIRLLFAALRLAPLLKVWKHNAPRVLQPNCCTLPRVRIVSRRVT